MLESGDAKTFLETSNDLEVHVRNKINRKRKKKKLKRREDERKKGKQEMTIRNITDYNGNDNKRKDIGRARAEMVENVHVEEPKREKKWKKEKSKRKEEDRNKRGQEMATREVTNDYIILDEKEVSSSRNEMAEGIKPKDNQNPSEVMTHCDLIHQTWKISEQWLKDLKEKGIKIKKGKWSLQELKLLQANVDRFLKNHELPDPVRFLVRWSTNREEKNFWRRSARENGFFRELGRGIMRPLDNINKCAVGIYDESNYIGKYSTEEVDKLERLYTVHGPDWITIGQLLGRSFRSVQRKYSKLPLIKGVRGTWTDEEVKLLKKAVYCVTNTAEDQPVPFHGIYWPSVAKIVKTRITEQCRKKW
ncbi:cyclin-D-binding Myb-like transcription factor 1 [Porites lutea]|uniref:cyclin-D-binding Myb-like transcription factor 1 n=1 Tax=Porites lutea TaxID=51062 RepID=UPI003CC6AD53